jgi:membrane-associated phospholipid phosphatase
VIAVRLHASLRVLKQWGVAVLKNRLALLIVLLVIEAQFFTINFLNARLRAPTDGWELRISLVDDHLAPHGTWLIPYTIGFLLAALLPVWAMFVMPNEIYRQYTLAFITAALFGYAIYILFPTYVTKPPPDAVPGSSILARMLRETYEADAKASTHNAAPSQHVFYAVLNAVFMIRFRPRLRVFWVWTTLAALICASTLLTMRHNSPDVITGYMVAVSAYYIGLWLGARVTARLGDADAPIAVPVLERYIPHRLRRRLNDLSTGLS